LQPWELDSFTKRLNVGTMTRERRKRFIDCLAAIALVILFFAALIMFRLIDAGLTKR
jgi:hypothetical protein